MARNVIIYDSTLREGEQIAGISFSISEKMDIAKKLLKIGVSNVEFGIWEVEEKDLISDVNFDVSLISQLSFTTLISLKSIEKAMKYGIKEINLLYPANTRFSMAMLGNKKMKNLAKEIYEILKKTAGKMNVNIVLADASRTNLKHLIEFAKKCADFGAHAVIYCDTIGILTPLDSYRIIKLLKSQIKNNIKLGVHFHNDFGLASANTLASIESGADFCVVSINGYGERSGIADLCEVVAGCKYLLKNVETGIDLVAAIKLSHDLQMKFGIAFSPLAPIKGDYIYRYESSLPILMLMKYKNKNGIFEPIKPEQINKKRQFLYGKFTGRKLIKFIAKRQRIKLSSDIISAVRSYLRKIALRRTRRISKKATLFLREYYKTIKGLGVREDEIINIIKRR